MLDERRWRYGLKQQDVEFYERLLPAEHKLLDALEAIAWESFTADLESFYCPDRGQPATPPLLLLKLEFLRYFYHLSDRQVIERAATDVMFRWFLQIPVACPLPVSTVLVKFRGRLGAEGFKKVFDRLVAEARRANLVRDRLRLKDATHVIARVAVPTTLKLLAQLRERMLAQVEGIDPEVAQGFRIEADRIREDTLQAEPEIGLEARVELIQEILLWLEQLPEPPEPESDRRWQQLEQVRQLARKILQDTQEPSKGGRTLSVVDPDARRSKHGQWYDGYTLDVMMDADSSIITAVAVLPAGGDEAADAVELVRQEQETHGNQIQNLSIDGVGFNGPMLHQLEDPVGLNVRVFVPAPEPDKELFEVSEFKLSEDGQRVTCPAGQSSRPGQRDDARHRTFFKFKRSTCETCPLRMQCKPVLGKDYLGGRGVVKNDYEADHQRARARTHTEEYAAIRREHPAIERKLNEVANHQKARHARYWGLGKTATQAFMSCFTVNVKQIVKLETVALRTTAA